MYNDNISSKFKDCLCNISLKYMVLKTISSANKPFIKDNLINIIEELFKKELYENNDCPIESDYIQILAEKFIDELEKEKLICKYTFANSKSEFHYIKLKRNFFTNFELKENNLDVNESNKQAEKQILLEENKNVEDEKENKLKLIEEIIQLKARYEKEKKTNNLQKKYIDTLHKYNEAKDMAQELLGSIAQNKGTLLKHLYEDMGISEDEEK